MCYVFQLEELSSSEAHNLFDACLLQHTHRSHSDHLTAMAAQINQSHRPLTVKVFAISISSGGLYRLNRGILSDFVVASGIGWRVSREY
jgi:hypothetical protein